MRRLLALGISLMVGSGGAACCLARMPALSRFELAFADGLLAPATSGGRVARREEASVVCCRVAVLSGGRKLEFRGPRRAGPAQRQWGFRSRALSHRRKSDPTPHLQPASPGRGPF